MDAPLVQAALNGARVAMTPAQLAADARSVVALGITDDVAAAIAGWVDPLPDMASVNLAEPDHHAVMRAPTARGLAVRIGREDVDVLPDGRAADENAALFAAAVAL